MLNPSYAPNCGYVNDVNPISAVKKSLLPCAYTYACVYVDPVDGEIRTFAFVYSLKLFLR